MKQQFSAQSAPSRWYVAVNGQPQGPYEQQQIHTWIRSGQINRATLICPEGGQEWRVINQWPPFAGVASGPTIATSRARQGGPSLRTIAIWHRRFTLGILGIGLAYAIPMFAADALPFAVAALCWLLAAAGQVALIIGLLTALGRSVGLLAVIAVLPLVGALVLLIVSRDATNRLTKAGVPVGLLGPKWIPRD